MYSVPHVCVNLVMYSCISYMHGNAICCVQKREAAKKGTDGGGSKGVANKKGGGKKKGAKKSSVKAGLSIGGSTKRDGKQKARSLKVHMYVM